MKFDNNLAAIHGYLCSDGYVIKNPQTQKHKYYHIALRNTNETLLKDFQEKFEYYFGIKPHITKDGRCRIQSKQIYEYLTKEYSYYCHEWNLPNLPKTKLKFWLRAFFDAEGWVECQEAKSRTIRLECTHLEGLESVKEALAKFGINRTSIKKKKGKKSWVINICGLDNLKKFKKDIGFLHPRKNNDLIKAINSYKNYFWKIPDSKEELINFLKEKGKLRKERAELRFNSIKKINLIKIKRELNKYKVDSKFCGPLKSGGGSIYYCLTIKSKEFNKLKA